MISQVLVLPLDRKILKINVRLKYRFYKRNRANILHCLIRVPQVIVLGD